MTTPSAAFLEYNEGKLTVRNGQVFFTDEGRAEYVPLYESVGLSLADGMDFESFRKDVLAITVGDLRQGEGQARQLLKKLDTPVDQKQILRQVVAPEDAAPSPPAAAPAKSAALFSLVPRRG